ncbi:uncharacterized protein BDZ99DRAFT_475505 [Mytilinidion resinicola]|uniref:Uncharacterized protein n=1 Tax=Mytilinidion resinicola TaxID=574789 RepID=A0A6A6YRQ6_9PEZI|nr:uncharacterized protein BDZ99DRAFT_475505 [Mytilinidion resinicola]KAF2810587.1 hypothetical protein BDZ99DRAFT_475505 [Mytilinidion resinicola]
MATKRKKGKNTTPRSTPAKKRKHRVTSARSTPERKTQAPSARTRPIVADFSKPDTAEPAPVAVRTSGRERKPPKHFGEGDTPEPARTTFIVPKPTFQEILDAVENYKPIRPPSPPPPRALTPPPKQLIKFKTKFWYSPEIQEEIERSEKLQKSGEVVVRIYLDPLRLGKRMDFEEVEWKALRGQGEYLLATHMTLEGWKAFKKNCEEGYRGDKQLRWVSLLDVDRGDFGVWAVWAEEWAKRKEAAEMAELAKKKGRNRGGIAASAPRPSAAASGSSVAAYGTRTAARASSTTGVENGGDKTSAQDVDGGVAQGAGELLRALSHANLSNSHRGALTAAAKCSADEIQPLEMEIEKMKWLSVHQQRKYIEELARAWLFANTYFLSGFQNYIMRCLVWHTRNMTGTSLPSHPSNLGIGLRSSWCESGIPLFDGILLKDIWKATEEPDTADHYHEWSGGKLRDFVYAAMVEAYYPESVPLSVWGAIVEWPGAHQTCDLGGSRRVWQVSIAQEREMFHWDADIFAKEVAPGFFVDVEERKREMEKLICKDKEDRNVVWERENANKPKHDKHLVLKKILRRRRMQGKKTRPPTRKVTFEDKEDYVRTGGAVRDSGIGRRTLSSAQRHVRFDLTTDHTKAEDRVQLSSQRPSPQPKALDPSDSTVRASTPNPEQFDPPTHDDAGNIYDIPDIIVTDADDEGTPDTVNKGAIDLTVAEDDHTDEDEEEEDGMETIPDTIVTDDQSEDVPDVVNHGTIDLTELSDGHSTDSSDSDEDEGEGVGVEVDGDTIEVDA